MIRMKKVIILMMAFSLLFAYIPKVYASDPFQFTPTADPIKYGLILTLIAEGLTYTGQKSSEAFQAMAEELKKKLSPEELNNIYEQVLKGYVTITSNLETQAKQTLVDWGLVHKTGEIVNYKAAGLVEKEDFRLGRSAYIPLNEGSFVVIRFPIPDYGVLDPQNPYTSTVRLSEDISGSSNAMSIVIKYYASSTLKSYVQYEEVYFYDSSKYGVNYNYYNSYGNTIYIQTSNNYKVNGTDVIDIKITDSYGLNKKVTYGYTTQFRELTLFQKDYFVVNFRPTVYYRDNLNKDYVYDPSDYIYNPVNVSLAGNNISIPVGADGIAIPIDNLYSYPRDQIIGGAIPVPNEGTSILSGILEGVNSLVGAVTGFFDLTKPINWQPMQNVGAVVTNKFPFSLPWDIARGIQGLEASPERPRIDGQWRMPWGDNINIKIEVPQWMDPIFELVRGGVVVLFVVGLIFAHGRLMGGQK